LNEHLKLFHNENQFEFFFSSNSYVDRIPDYRLFLPIRNETFDVFDSTLHPIETTILQLRIVASHRSGLPLSAFRLITDHNTELFDHVRLSQYDIGLFPLNNYNYRRSIFFSSFG
jgi:hypothetical protein